MHFNTSSPYAPHFYITLNLTTHQFHITITKLQLPVSSFSSSFAAPLLPQLPPFHQSLSLMQSSIPHSIPLWCAITQLQLLVSSSSLAAPLPSVTLLDAVLHSPFHSTMMCNYPITIVGLLHSLAPTCYSWINSLPHLNNVLLHLAFCMLHCALCHVHMTSPPLLKQQNY
jgi:hypothetical protein